MCYSSCYAITAAAFPHVMAKVSLCTRKEILLFRFPQIHGLTEVFKTEDLSCPSRLVALGIRVFWTRDRSFDEEHGKSGEEK